jgi:hypothetical protein
MKLLLAFKSFLPRRLIVEIGSENWFAAGCQFGSDNCFAVGSQFGSENCFAAGAPISAANANSYQTTQFRQRITISLQPTQLRQRFAGDNSTLAANANSLQKTQFR